MGFPDGILVGDNVGDTDGISVIGWSVGGVLGTEEGLIVVGNVVGLGEGEGVGLTVVEGNDVGSAVG